MVKSDKRLLVALAGQISTEVGRLLCSPRPEVRVPTRILAFLFAMPGAEKGEPHMGEQHGISTNPIRAIRERTGRSLRDFAADLKVSWVSLQAAETGAVGWPRGIMSALEEAGLGNAGDLRVSYDNWREARKKQAKAFFANQKAGGAGA